MQQAKRQIEKVGDKVYHPDFELKRIAALKATIPLLMKRDRDARDWFDAFSMVKDIIYRWSCLSGKNIDIGCNPTDSEMLEVLWRIRAPVWVCKKLMYRGDVYMGPVWERIQQGGFPRRARP